MPKKLSTAKVKKTLISKKNKKPVKKVIAKKTGKKITKKVTAASKVKAKKVKVLAIPKGYHSVTPYLIVDNAIKAIEFYKKAFGAKLGSRMDSSDGKIAHAVLKIGDANIMLADECPEINANSPKAFGGAAVGLHLYVKNVDKIVTLATEAGAKLVRPVENMFYGDRCGTLEDPFGHSWYVATHVENVSTRELKKRAAQAFTKK